MIILNNMEDDRYNKDEIGKRVLFNIHYPQSVFLEKKVKAGNIVDFYPTKIEELAIASSDEPSYNFTTINFRSNGRPIKMNYSESKGHIIFEPLGEPTKRELHKIWGLIKLIYDNKEYP